MQALECVQKCFPTFQPNSEESKEASECSKEREFCIVSCEELTNSVCLKWRQLKSHVERLDSEGIPRATTTLFYVQFILPDKFRSETEDLTDPSSKVITPCARHCCCVFPCQWDYFIQVVRLLRITAEGECNYSFNCKWSNSEYLLLNLADKESVHQLFGVSLNKVQIAPLVSSFWNIIVVSGHCDTFCWH